MPFDSAFDDVYHLGIKQSCEEAGAYCERVDEQIFHERILDRIYNQIAKADCIIADMTGRNPNVFYEVGYAHALGKPTILLTQHADDIPFDLKHFPHIVYQSRIVELKEQLARRVKWFVENPQEDRGKFNEEVQVFVNGKTLTSTGEVFESRRYVCPNIELTLRNSSAKTIYTGSVRVGILVGGNYDHSRSSNVRTIKLPDERWLHMLPDLTDLLPEEYFKINFLFTAGDEHYQEVPIIIRIFSEKGNRDYPVLVKWYPHT